MKQKRKVRLLGMRGKVGFKTLLVEGTSDEL